MISNLPQWTKRVVIKATGRDPLGLSRVSEKITDFLLPAIITTTNRARYYSFYPWCFWHMRATGEFKRQAEFLEALQRREAAFAIASLIGESESSIVGYDQATIHLDEANTTGEVDTAFQVLPSNPMGGYGQYYGGCVSSRLGLIGIDEDGFEFTTQGRGEKLAEAFQRVVDRSSYSKEKRYEAPTFPLRDLNDSYLLYSLDSISTDACSEERQLLVEMFFSLGAEDEDARPFLRRQSLGLILNLLYQYNQVELEVERPNVLWSLVFSPHYYGQLSDEKHPSSFVSPIHFSQAHGMWKQYCLHQFTARALEEVLNAALSTLSAHGDGLEFQEIVSSLVSPEFVLELESQVGAACNSPSKFLASFGIESIPTPESSARMQASFKPPNPLCEWDILEGLHKNLGSLSRSILTLTIIYGKWRGVNDDPCFSDVSRLAGPELWAGSTFPLFDDWVTNSEESWGKAVADLLGLVVRHHDEVMFQKGRLDACWIGRNGDRFFKEQDVGPFFRSSRHENALSILWDLCLVELSEENSWSISEEGKSLLHLISQEG